MAAGSPTDISYAHYAGVVPGLEPVSPAQESGGIWLLRQIIRLTIPQPFTYIHELHEAKLLFVSRVEFIRSKLLFLFAHVNGATA